MPIHVRKLPQTVKYGSEQIAKLSEKILTDLDALKVKQEQAISGRWKMAMTTLHTVTEQAEAVAALVICHKVSETYPLLRAAVETYTRLTYVLLGDGDSRLTALTWLDVTQSIKNIDQIASAYKEHDKQWPDEAPLYTPELRTNLKRQRKTMQKIHTQLGQQLENEALKEYCTAGKLDHGQVKQALSMNCMSARIDDEKRVKSMNANAKTTYAMVYGYLSSYMHASTLHLSGLLTQQPDGSIHINSTTPEQNEEDSLRSLFTAYGLLSDTYLEVLEELGRDTETLRNRYSKTAESIFPTKDV